MLLKYCLNKNIRFSKKRGPAAFISVILRYFILWVTVYVLVCKLIPYTEGKRQTTPVWYMAGLTRKGTYFRGLIWVVTKWTDLCTHPPESLMFTQRPEPGVQSHTP